MARRKFINPAGKLRIKPDPKLIQRIMARIKVDDNGCWIWQGCVDENGYGRIKVAGRSIGIHRVTFALYKRPIRHLQEIDHHEGYCHSHSCCNPAHLRESSKSTNSSRGACRRRRPTDDIPF